MQPTHSIYQSIGSNAIRLLSIKAALADEQIECALITVDNLDEAPPFEAVSYVWGQELSPVPVFCNGAQKLVTRNLEDALRYLRPLPNWNSVPVWSPQNPLHSSRHVWRDFARNRYEQHENATSLQRLVWIDALCINQDEMAERASQVKLMGRIYQKAADVKIWLGNAAPDMPTVLALIAQALRNVGEQQEHILELRPSYDKEYKNVVHGLPRPSAAAWDVFRTFFSNPWFERVWIVQEAVLARTAVVIVGDWHIDWAALGQAAAWFTAQGYSLPRTLTAPNFREATLLPVASAAALWEIHALEGKRAPLLYLLKEFRLRLAGQQVDKLYATFGLAEETADVTEGRWDKLLEPNYDKPVEAVYRDAARFLINKYGSLLVLSQVDRHPSGPQSLPSWAPDWSRVKASSAIWSTSEQRGCNADGGEPFSLDTAQNEDHLLLKGVRADIILSYTNKLENRGTGNVVYEKERGFISDSWRLASSLQHGHGNAESQASAPRDFVEALTAGSRKYSNDVDTAVKDASAWFMKYLGHELVATGGSMWKWANKAKADRTRFHQAFVRSCTDRRFFITQSGLMGIGPAYMAADDAVVVLFGAKVPFVMRQQGRRYRLIGECYIPGLMNGEVVEKWRASGQRPECFEIR